MLVKQRHFVAVVPPEFTVITRVDGALQFSVPFANPNGP